jgi:hypothetical protein
MSTITPPAGQSAVAAEQSVSACTCAIGGGIGIGTPRQLVAVALSATTNEARITRRRAGLVIEVAVELQQHAMCRCGPLESQRKHTIAFDLADNSVGGGAADEAADRLYRNAPVSFLKT